MKAIKYICLAVLYLIFFVYGSCLPEAKYVCLVGLVATLLILWTDVKEAK